MIEFTHMINDHEPNRSKEPSKSLPGFINETKIGRGAQRITRTVQTLLPTVKERATTTKELMNGLNIPLPLSLDVELILWDEALNTLPDKFWQEELDMESQKPDDPTKSIN